MKTEEVKIRLYQIKKCGYFIGNKNEFGALTEVLDNLQEWVSTASMTVKDSQTFTVDEEATTLPVYCVDMIKSSSSNDWLLVLWNETETHDGSHASIVASDGIGSATVKTIEVDEDAIAGFPTYFLILGDQAILTTIQISTTINGKAGFDKYIRGFLERFSKWVQVTDGHERSLDSDIAGYAINTSDNIDDRVKPEFLTKLAKSDGDIAYIKKNRSKIAKIHRKSVFTQSSPKGPHTLGSFLKEFAGFKPTAPQITESQFKFDVKVTPTKQELDDIIETWEKKPDTWGDVGFSFTGLQEKKWLGSAILKDKLEIKVKFDEQKNLYDAEFLLSEILKHKSSIVTLGGKSKAK